MSDKKYQIGNVSDIYQAPGEMAISAAPEWMQSYLAKLCKATGYQEHIEIAVADAKYFVGKRIGVTDSPDGFLHVSNSLPPIIIVRGDTEDNDRGRNLICHEFAHALHMPVDRIAWSALSDDGLRDYAEAVEVCLKPLQMLLRLVDYFDIEWVDEDEDA